MKGPRDLAESIFWHADAPMLYGLPRGTEFTHEISEGNIVCWLSTPRLGILTTTVIEKDEVLRPLKMFTNHHAAEFILSRLRELHDEHWLTIFWPDLDSVT